MATQGFEPVEDAQLSLRWLWRSHSSVGFLHVHWPEGLYRYQRGPPGLRQLLSRVKLVLFAARLRAARLLGFREEPFFELESRAEAAAPQVGFPGGKA